MCSHSIKRQFHESTRRIRRRRTGRGRSHHRARPARSGAGGSRGLRGFTGQPRPPQGLQSRLHLPRQRLHESGGTDRSHERCRPCREACRAPAHRRSLHVRRDQRADPGTGPKRRDGIHRPGRQQCVRRRSSARLRAYQPRREPKRRPHADARKNAHASRRKRRGLCQDRGDAGLFPEHRKGRRADVPFAGAGWADRGYPGGDRLPRLMA